MSFLIGENMTGGYGAADILHGCTVSVELGEIVVIVGPNGAGKSTAMKALFGMLDLRGGSVRLDGEDITALSPQARVRHGMGFVLTEEWTQYLVPFAAVAQEEWGTPVAFDATQVMAMHFQVAQGPDFEISIDDIGLYE